MKDSVGIPEEWLRKVMAEKPGEFDPRKYLGPAGDALKVLYSHKNENVLGSAEKA